MMKLKNLIKDLELGKVYTDKDRKPFKVNEERLNEFNKAHFLNLIKQEIDSLKGQIAYSKDKVRYKGTPDWEKKEFKAVLKDKVKDLAKTIKHYKRVQSMKEGQLSEKVNQSKVNASFTRVVAFIRKESKKLNDDDLYEMTRKLEKWLK